MLLEMGWAIHSLSPVEQVHSNDQDCGYPIGLFRQNVWLGGCPSENKATVDA